MTKYKTFFNNLISVLNRYDAAHIKTTIGDSTNNHRTATVSQVIRFLSLSNNPAFVELGSDLSEAYEALQEDLTFYRENNNNRSDAYDINEFIDIFSIVVINGDDKQLKSELNEQLIASSL